MNNPDLSGKVLLIVSFSYAPMQNPRAYRWTALAEEFARRGALVHVVSSWQPGLAARETRNGVTVHRVGNRMIEHCRDALARHRSQPEPVTQSSARRRIPLRAAFAWMWRQLAWPDTTCVWYGAALRELKFLLRAAPEATLVTVSPSFTAALTGIAVARKGLTKRWVVDIGDPFSLAVESPANNFALYGALNKSIEHAAFQKAAAVCLTNTSVMRAYAELYPACAGKLAVIPPLLPTIPPQRREEPAPRDGHAPLRLLYVGTLYKSLRRPEFLLALFVALIRKMPHHKFELHFIGNIDECADAFVPYASELGRTIKLHGMLEREAALTAIDEATIVVNLGNTNPCQLPSKLVEYMALAKPILNILQTDADPSLELLGTYAAVINVFATGRAPTSAQVAKVEWHIERMIDTGRIERDELALRPFALANVAAQYCRVLFGDSDALC